MHNNIKNNERDAFSESIRQKLEGHQTPVEPALWDAVAAGLNATKETEIFICMVDYNRNGSCCGFAFVC